MARTTICVRLRRLMCGKSKTFRKFRRLHLGLRPGLRPKCGGRSPKSFDEGDGKSKTFRTSGGEAARKIRLNFRRVFSDLSIDQLSHLRMEKRLFAAIVMVLLLVAPALAASTVEDYLARIDRAEEIVHELIEENLTAGQTSARLESIKRILPIAEDIEAGGRKIRIDNQWLYEAIDEISPNTQPDPEQRRSMLVDLDLRFSNLNARVRDGLAPRTAADQDLRPKLDEILSRPEYRPQHEEESSIRGWARKLKKLITDLLNKTFGSAAPRPVASNQGEGAAFFRMIILVATIISLVIGIYRLSRFRFRRKKAEEESEIREVLGEEIAADATAADLLSAARELAQKGEFRAAIRRTYIAMLFEYEQRGKLNLHRAKTNRDYLNALRPETAIFPSFSSMTGDFERVWYGQQRATEAEFDRFVAQYQETIKS
jgi:hypothetical protein